MKRRSASPTPSSLPPEWTSALWLEIRVGAGGSTFRSSKTCPLIRAEGFSLKVLFLEAGKFRIMSKGTKLKMLLLKISGSITYMAFAGDHGQGVPWQQLGIRAGSISKVKRCRPGLLHVASPPSYRGG